MAIPESSGKFRDLKTEAADKAAFKGDVAANNPAAFDKLTTAEIRAMGLTSSQVSKILERREDGSDVNAAGKGFGRELAAEQFGAKTAADEGKPNEKPAWKRALEVVANIMGLNDLQTKHAEADLGGKAAGNSGPSTQVVAQVAGNVSGQNISGLSKEVLDLAMAEGAKLKAGASMDHEHSMTYAGVGTKQQGAEAGIQA